MSRNSLYLVNEKPDGSGRWYSASVAGIVLKSWPDHQGAFEDPCDASRVAEQVSGHVVEFRPVTEMVH